MGQIFISYSSKDDEFALQLFESLEPFYDVWIDRDDIKGGSEWEKMIQEAITNCDVFLIAVSAHSNDSNWVMRETILAENLKKYRIPILIDGNMPFRLLELQYIDFRADYSGGLRDLLSVLQSQISQDKSSDDEINRLIGAGVLSHFDNDTLAAKNLFGQVAIIKPEIEDKMSDLNALLKGHYAINDSQRDLASDLMQTIHFVEKAKISEQSLYAQDTTYEWSLAVDSNDSTRQNIDFVKYILHPTFVNPERIIRSRDSNFKLEMVGWGTFTVNIEVHFIDGTIGKTSHDLTFDSALE